MNAQQLKNAILQEAIEGRLVPQDPNDEPASILLERIRKEKERLVKEGKLKKKDLEVKPISEDEIPFDIPDSWEWVRLNGITELIEDCPHSTAPDEGEGYPLIRTPNIGFGKLLLDKVHRVSEKVYNKRNERAIPLPYDLIYAREATAGNVAVIAEGQKVCLGQRTVLVRPIKGFINSYWLAYFILSPYSYKRLVGESTGTTVAHVNLSDFRPFVLPLPPFAEQRRIVAKIEELLPKVEKYGKAQDELNKLNEELPERLKKSILQEAIEGRLVPQDPSDEPASVLLQKIREEKQQLVKAGKLKKKDLIETPINEDEIPFYIPDSWEWVRLSTISKTITKGTTPRGGKVAYSSSGVGFLRAENVAGFDKLDLSSMKYVTDREHNGFLSRSILEANDLLITIAGTLGRTALVRVPDLPLNANQAVSLVRFVDSKALSLLYVIYALNAPISQKVLTNQKKVTAIPNLTLEIIGNCIIPFPPLAEQKRIVAKIEEVFKEIDKLKASC